MVPILIIFLFVIAYSFSHQTKMSEYINKNQDLVKSCTTHAECNDEPQQPNKFYGCFNKKCQTVAIGTCFSADECSGQPMAVVQCSGAWKCEKSGMPYGKCNWVCS